MHHIIYLSSATHLMNLDELYLLLDQSRKRNLEANITGALFYSEGSFLQDIEGEKKDVENLFSVIKTDDRHTRVTILFNEEIEKREFSNWSMAFSNLDDNKIKLPDAYSDVLNKPYSKLILEEYPLQVRSFLELFYQGSRFTY